jgi:hypothetical protein
MSMPKENFSKLVYSVVAGCVEHVEYATCDIPKKKKNLNLNLLENYSVFSKFEFGSFLPFMAILNFEFNNFN